MKMKENIYLNNYFFVDESGDTTFYAIWTEKEKPSGGVFIHDGTMWQLISG